MVDNEVLDAAQLRRLAGEIEKKARGAQEEEKQKLRRNAK